MKKIKDLFIIGLIYLLAYAIGIASCFWIQDIMMRFFVFDIAATVITFIFSLALHNSSVYDAYWSLTPMVMSVWLFIVMRAFSFWQILFLTVFNVWSARLTANWIGVFTDFSYEDWRYRMFREENKSKPVLWFIINFCGIHLVPTLVVFAGMLPLFEIAKVQMNVLSVFGMLIILMGVAFEFYADKQMHTFLEKTTEKKVCRNGLWKYSRHPNYLGEITVWVGVYVTMIPFAWNKWYYVIGAMAVFVLFNAVSIPMMEKRQRARRRDYVEYVKSTSRLLILPCKKG